MAITFSKSISTSILLNAYNNNVVEFTSSAIPVGETITKATILISGSTFTITPISDVLEFNFREVVNAILNNDFEDAIVPDTYLEADATLIGSYTVTYTVTFSDLTTENIAESYTFIKSVEQIANITSKSNATQSFLNQSSQTFFYGYPFDLQRYSRTVNSNLTVTNLETLGVDAFTLAATNLDRFYFLKNGYAFEQRALALGATYVENPCNLNGLNYGLLKIGYNTITMFDNTTTDTFNIKLEDVDCGGTYLKWVNEEGGYSYWLFHPVHKTNIKTKTAGKFNTDFDNLATTFTTSLISGKTATNTRSLIADQIDANELNQIKSIIASPRVEMYNGTYMSDPSTGDWQTVDVFDGNFLTESTKRGIGSFKIKIKINKFTQI